MSACSTARKPARWPRCWPIAERKADLPLDLADASIAESAARLRIHRVLTIATDFDVDRDDSGRPLINVLRHPAAERGIAPTVDDD